MNSDNDLGACMASLARVLESGVHLSKHFGASSVPIDNNMAINMVRVLDKAAVRLGALEAEPDRVIDTEILNSPLIDKLSFARAKFPDRKTVD